MERKQNALELLRRADRAAQQELESILASPGMSPEALYQHLRRYTLAKFLLEDDCLEDDFFALAEISMGRALDLDSDMVKKSDLSLHCSGASSVATKKVLLFMSLQKGLDIKFTPEEVPAIKTIEDLSKVVYSLRREKVKNQEVF